MNNNSTKIKIGSITFNLFISDMYLSLLTQMLLRLLTTQLPTISVIPWLL